MSMSRSEVATVNVFPAVTACGVLRASEQRNVPAVEALQALQCEYVSEVLTAVQGG